MSAVPVSAFSATRRDGDLLLELLHLDGWAIAITGGFSESESGHVVVVARRHPYAIRVSGPSSAECALPVYCAAQALRRAARA